LVMGLCIRTADYSSLIKLLHNRGTDIEQRWVENKRATNKEPQKRHGQKHSAYPMKVY